MSDATRPDLPARTAKEGLVRSRNLSTQELEAVIRRAIELQSGPASREEGVSQEEVLRIAQELGLDASSVRRAIAEVRTRPPAEQGKLGVAMGRVVARAARVLPRRAAEVGPQLEQYLRESELMVVQRRFPERTRYVRNPSFAAGIARMVGEFSRSQQALDVKQVDVAVSDIDNDTCMVELSVDMHGVRAGMAAGALGGGGGLAVGLAATIWATPVADPLMLLAVPFLGAAWYGMRAIYGAVHRGTEERLESLLDRLEHGEL